MSYRLWCKSTSAITAVATFLAAPAVAQEVRGPESPTETSGAPSPASTATGVPPGATSAASATKSTSVAPASAQGLGDIVVTARKVSENLQRVPVAVTAFSGAALQASNVVDVIDVAKLTPGLSITQSQSSGVAALFTIRGQVQTDNTATLDPSVGLYVDGMYWARAFGVTADFLDIQSVQTLKGPQGTLFGRNTTGGAILIQTNDPSFRGISGLVSGTYGRFNQASVTGIVNVPLIDDKLAVRVAYQRNTRDGYAEDEVNGVKNGSKHDYTVRAKLLYKPTDNLSILLSGERYRTSFLNDPFRLQYITPGSPASLEAGVDSSGGACFSGGLAGCATAGSTAAAATIAAANSGDHVSLNVDPRSFAKTQTYSATVTLDTFFGAIKAVGGYRNVKSLSDVDLDGSDYNILATRGFQDLSQYSVEVQATGKAFDNKLDFAAGVFYFHESGYDRAYSAALNALNPSIQYFSGDIDNDSQGIYGQANYHLTDKLTFTGGVRYSVDDKRLVSNNGVYSSGTYASAAPNATFTCLLTTCPDERHASFGGVSWTGGVDYRFTPTVLAYAKASRGFRSGGENIRGTSNFPLSTNSFAPEKATSYEGGLKTEFFNHRLRVNVAGYYTTVDDIQRSSLVFLADGSSATIITNAGQADFYGGEVEANALLFGGIQLGASGAYVHPKYKTYTDPVTGFDRSHEPFALVARWTATVSPSYSHEFGFGRFLLRGDFAYQSKMVTYNFGSYVDNNGITRNASDGTVIDPAVAAGISKAITDKAGWVVNARTSVTVLKDKLEVALWGKNLLDRRDNVSALPVPAVGVAAAIRREPRTFGITGTFRFGS